MHSYDKLVAPVQDVMQKYSSSWTAEAWAEAYARALAYVFELPHARTVEPAEAQDMVCDLPYMVVSVLEVSQGCC